MPFIRVRKKGAILGLMSDNEAYELIEVDNYGNPVTEKSKPSTAFTEKKLAPGVREPDTRKGYTKPFNYREWNKIRAKKKR